MDMNKSRTDSTILSLSKINQSALTYIFNMQATNTNRRTQQTQNLGMHGLKNSIYICRDVVVSDF